MTRKSNEYNGRRRGYLRCSRDDQKEDRQIDGLLPHCDEMHVEFTSAVSPDRPVFDKLITTLLQPGDMLVVLDIDRAFRSSIDALLTERQLRERGIALKIVSVALDTITAEGEFIFTLLCAMAQFERRMLSRRTKEGLAAARRRGQQLGRPPKLSDEQVRDAKRRLAEKTDDITGLAKEFGVSSATLSRSLRRERHSFLHDKVCS